MSDPLLISSQLYYFHRFEKCSRWDELVDTLNFHVSFSQTSLTPCVFHLLNASHAVRVGMTKNDDEDVVLLRSALLEKPSGHTPLCRHIREVIIAIQEVEGQLRAAGQKACVVICTDGESSDGDVREALRPLKQLPACIILRLCTNEQRIIDYWNNVDQELGLNMDVLDDLANEAKEIYLANPWLTYALPFHRMREFGVTLDEFDALDERLLKRRDMGRVCRLIYGPSLDPYMDMRTDWADFVTGVRQGNNAMHKVWSPGDGRMRDWIDVFTLQRCYKPTHLHKVSSVALSVFSSKDKNDVGGCWIM